MTDPVDDEFQALEEARPIGPGADDLETDFEQETPTVGGDQVGGVALEFDEDEREREDVVDEPPVRSQCRFCELEFRSVVAERRHDCPDRRDLDLRRVETEAAFIDPQVHELSAHYLFEPLPEDLRSGQDGMAPYFGVVSQFDRCLQDGDAGDDIGTFEAAGDHWRLDHERGKVSYRDAETAKIKTRPGDSGKAYYEYVLGVVACDELGERKCTFQVRPALPEARHADTDERIKSMPASMPHGVRIEAQSSNMDIEEQLEVWRALMESMGVDTAYFKEECIHDWSRVFNIGMYVRLVKEVAQREFVEINGVLERLSQFSSIRRGQGEYKWDNKEAIGHRHAVAINETSLEKIYEGHSVGKLMKYYLPEHANRKDESDPLYHPKVEVQYSTSYSDFLGGSSVPYRDEDGFDYFDLKGEMDEFLLYGLTAAGIPLEADPEYYVADDYWLAQSRERDVALHADPTDELREVEEDLTRAQLAREDLTRADRAVIEALVDGGRSHYEELVEASGTSSSSVYRAIDKFGSLVERVGRGSYDIADDVVRSKIDDVFQTLESVTEWVEDGIEAIVDGSGEISEDSALAMWARRHGAVLGDVHGGLEVKLTGRYDKFQLQQLLRAGLQAARDTGSITAGRFIEGSYTYRVDGDLHQDAQPFTTVGGGVRALGAPVR